MSIEVSGAVGSDEAYPAATGYLHNLLLRLRPLAASLCEPTGDYEGGFDTLTDAVLHGSGKGFGGDGYHGEVHMSRNISQTGIGFNPEHIGSVLVYGIDIPFASGQEQLEDVAAPLAGDVRCSDDCHRTGFEEIIQMLDKIHDLFSSHQIP